MLRAGIALLLISIFLLTYPFLTQKIYEKEAGKVIEEFEGSLRAAEERDPDFLEDLFQEMQAYNRKLYESGQKDLSDPFAYQNVDFSLKDWGFDEEIIGSIVIPRMEIELPLYLGASEEHMKKGAAHLSMTSLPVGGANTNAVIAAHRGYSRAAMFRDIEKLQIGDEVTIRNFHDDLTYKVAEIKIIKPTEINEVLIRPGRDLVTLITCHPYMHNYQRYVVYCERVREEPE